MQPLLSIHGGLPLCVARITKCRSLSIEIQDHDLRREALKKKQIKPLTIEELQQLLADLQMGGGNENEGDKDDGDHYFPHRNMGFNCTAARAA